MTQTTPDQSQSNLIELDIEFDGTPRSLAQIAKILDKINLAIITAITKRHPKATTARLDIIADPATSPYGIRELQSTLAQLPEILTVTIATAPRSRLHL